MRKPARTTPKANDTEIFINGAEQSEQALPGKNKLNRKYDKATGKTINVRIPEYYAKCLSWLADNDNRSQHGELLHLIQTAIDNAIKDTKRVSK